MLALVGATDSATEIQKLLASDDAERHQFGGSVSLSGDVAVIGAVGDDYDVFNTGSAYVFERQADGSWTEQQKLSASDGSADDQFSSSVSVFGDVAVMGTYLDDDNYSNAGAVYVYERQTDSSWTEEAKLLTSDGAEDDFLVFQCRRPATLR
ncbi:MAG: FG-GAP repeat protein [Candidatus Latescibacteria bacterium]|jgi:hypothetical protein|nr:FG-GAP repeat protein [Candidatus Latescibacterota bacterium]